MPIRKTKFVNGSVYHIYNRGVEKRNIFTLDENYLRYIELMCYYSKTPRPKFSDLTINQRNKIVFDNKGNKLVSIHCYCLMPNHFHLLLTQQNDNGIRDFINHISIGYSKYFNILNQRVGHLYQGAFKAVTIENNEQLLHISRYIHLNPLVGGIVDRLDNYPFSSYKEYINKKYKGFCEKDIILNQFSSSRAYSKFINDYKDYALKLNEIKKLLQE